MPTYEFYCDICRTHFEKNISFNGNAAQVFCPNGHNPVRKIFSLPNIVYKGKGFYKTDNRQKKPISAEKSSE